KEKGDSVLEPAETVIAGMIADNVEEIWAKASLPTVTKKEIKRKILKYHDEYTKKVDLLRRRKGHSQASITLTEIADYRKQKESQLFDISLCKCKDFGSCICPSKNRVPAIEQEFLVDQRTVRLLHISGIDRMVTEKNKKKQNRHEQVEARRKRYEASKAAAMDMSMSQEE